MSYTTPPSPMITTPSNHVRFLSLKFLSMRIRKGNVMPKSAKPSKLPNIGSPRLGEWWKILNLVNSLSN